MKEYSFETDKGYRVDSLGKTAREAYNKIKNTYNLTKYYFQYFNGLHIVAVGWKKLK